MDSNTNKADGLREFQIMRLLVLTGLGQDNPNQCSDSDLFAWSSSTFPIFTSGSLHRGFEEFFHPTEQMMDVLSKKLNDAFLKDSAPPTVYQLETELGIRSGDSSWTRSDLINALRYFSFCSDRFTPEFWVSMTRDAGAPSEANSFFRPFEPKWDASPY
ncbi:hypothetical protein PUT78_11260 [Roseinatronobacter sp. HJB301]|uniref:Uncharacterized protein n=1 Tax=Roseinatronobacter alkalisoli TaxID=3028235 RepID=A0ABT5T989_9RHOB|nr:hypothetical protein [Roseinatronobacter sp. HJB301]